MSVMTDSSNTATVPGSVVLDSGVVPCFNVESGILAQTKKGSTPPGRLTSLRTRDLTLSGAFKKSKVCTNYRYVLTNLDICRSLRDTSFWFSLPQKTFEPNVHALRKSKDEWVAISDNFSHVVLVCSNKECFCQIKGRGNCFKKG